MKKIPYIFLVLLLCFSLVGCSDSQNVDSQNSQIEQLQNDINNLQKQLDSIVVERDSLKDELDNVKTQLNSVTAERDALISEKEELEKEVTVSDDDVTIVVVDKVNTPKDSSNWIFSSYSTFHISITNNTDKPIKGIQGSLEIQDMFGVSIYKANCDLTGTEIKPSETIINKDMSLEINEFMDDHCKVYNTDFKDLKFVYHVNTIMFTDGTTKTK